MTAPMVKYCYNSGRAGQVKFMVKKLAKHGNSLALVIDKGELVLLDIDDKTPLDTSGRWQVADNSPHKGRKKGNDSNRLWK